MMKTKVLLTMVLMMGLLSLSSFSAGKAAQSERVVQKRTIIEFGDYYYNGNWFYVYGDPATGEITSIIPFSYIPGTEIASWTGGVYYFHGAWHGAFTVTPVVGSSYYIGAELVFA